MLRHYRFLLISLVTSLAALLVCFGLADAQPVGAFAQATAAATAASEPQGDAARGQYLVQVAGCGGCHGAFKLASDKGVPLAGGNEFKSPLGTFYSPNLTMFQDVTYKDLDKPLRQGISLYSSKVLAPIMPYNTYHNLSDNDVASIAAYLRSLTPVDNNIPASQPGAGMSSLKPLPAQSIAALKMDDSADYGGYLVNVVASCGSCHSSRSAGAGRELSGGSRNLGTDDHPIYGPSINGSALMANGYTKENFAATLKLGIRPRGAPLAPQMPWRRFSRMTDSDMAAMWNYLQTKKLDSPWPVQTAAPTAASTVAATRAATAAATGLATSAPTQAAAATAAK